MAMKEGVGVKERCAVGGNGVAPASAAGLEEKVLGGEERRELRIEN